MAPLFGTHIKNTTVTKLRECSVKLQGSSKVGIRDTLVFMIGLKFRQIGHTTSQYGQSFFPKTISAWNGIAFAEAPSLAVFISNFY